MQPKKKERYNAKARQHKRGETPAVAAAIDSNADIIDTAALAEIKKAQEAEKNEPAPMSKKKRKRLEQYINRKLKKEERVDLIAQLATSSFDHSLLHSSAKLGRGVGKETKREKLKRALTEEKLGLTPSTDIYVNKSTPPQDDDDEDEDMAEATSAFPIRPVALARPTVMTVLADDGAALSDGEPADAQPSKKRKKNKKQKVKKEPVTVEEFRRLDDSDSDTEPILIPTTASSKPKVYVVPNRDAAVQEGRLNLPVVQEEDRVMETLNSHSVTVLCGETGSGKTTQVPQFLYEAGYSHPDSDFPGWIGVTQPRRVAAVAMAERVGHELNAKDQVSYQIRFEKTTTPSTRIHFMTDGVLLKEVSSDLLLSKYSVMIVDEAHERNLNTDILIGVLSRVVKLRDQLHAEWVQKKAVADKLGQAFRDPRVTPLKLIIMSATLRVSDFTENARLFPVPPPVINVQARQFPVTVHFNRRTPRDHVFDAYRKVCKIHARLPAGGILVFMTGQNEIYDLITRLKRKYDPAERARIAQAKLDKLAKNMPKGKGKSKSAAPAPSFDEDRTASLEDRMAEVDEGLVNHARVDASVKSDERAMTQGATTVLVDESSANKDEGTTRGDEGDDEDEFELSDDDDDQDADLDEDYDPAQRDDFDEIEDEDHTDQPLHVLPLYSLLSTDQQMKVFDAVPEGHRLCVVATNVAETSLTIPGIRYVVDCGKAKEKVYDPATSIQSFVVSWTSKASADQRAGRAGRTGPGHCYRLYSSAVYDQQFQQFSLPEILRMPIDSVVLQLKAMNMDNVINFPFPTPPNRTDLAKAEKLLQSLGALDEQGHITLTGTKMSQFPIHPRFAKMLLLGMQQGLIEYAIAIVAALSVGEVFVSPDEAKRLLAERKRNKGGNVNDADAQLDEDAMDVADDDVKDKDGDDDGAGATGQLFKSVMDKFSGKPRTSDALFLLNLVGAFEYAGGSTKFCRTHLLRPKAMLEIRALRRQLTAMVQNVNPKLHVTMNPRMQPPNETQMILLRQLLLAGFVDQLAIPHPHPPLNDEDRPRHYMYQSMVNDAICCIARNSVLAGARPSALVFTQLQQGTRNVWMKGVTAVDLAWVPVVGKDLCVFSKPLEMPAPTYDAKSDMLTCHVVPRIGPYSWELPTTKVPLTKPPAVHQWFARYLLEGKVLPGWAPLNAVWVTQPSAITKDTYRGQKRVLALVQDLMVKKVASKAQLLEVWKTNPAYLLDAVVQWVPPELADAVRRQWPMTKGSFKS